MNRTNSRTKNRKLIITSILGAITVALGFTPLGFIPLGIFKCDYFTHSGNYRSDS